MPTVLIVEPASQLRDACAKACEVRGIAVGLCDNVGAALLAVCESQPTAILSSCMLPGLPGFSLVAALKSCAHHRAIPIALLTSDSDPVPEHQFFKSDCVIHSRGDVAGEIDRFLDSMGLDSMVKRPDGSPELPLEGKILFVEDVSITRKLMGHFLHVAGAEVVVVENGLEALMEAARTAFDLILMDLEMPVMDGRTATRTLRNKGETIPIIALTAHVTEELELVAPKFGFTEILGKPVDRKLLIKTCARYIGRK